ncbi:MAG TPA: replicative DNA helicase [Armatimonadota bacterium]|jgi:replicative DNA helicase
MATSLPLTLAERIPPQNLEAEQATLGSMLLERDAIAQAADYLLPEDFYREAHQQIFRGILDIFRRNEPVDLITLGEWLQAREQLEMVGGTHYLTTLMAQTPTAAGITYYCDIVRDKSRRRALIRMADRLVRDVYSEEDGTALIANYQRELDRIELGATADEGQQLYKWEELAVQEMQDADTLGHDVGIRTNLPSLNKVLDPFLPGEVIIIAGRPSTGKSVLAMQLALSACEKQGRVLFLSVEMAGKSLATRAMIAEAGVPAWKTKMLNYRKAHAGEVYGPLIAAIERHQQYDLEVTRPRNLTPYDVQVLGRRKRHTGGLDMVVIDYLQLMTANDKYRDAYERVSAISREIKESALVLGVPIIVVSQLSREVERRSPKRPMMSDLRESGQVEQDADAILLLYRPGYYDADNFAENRRVGLEVGDKNSTEIIVAKQRNGQTGSTWVYFDLERSHFYELDEREEEGAKK